MNSKVPEGWENKALGVYVGVQGGHAFKSNEFHENGTPVVRISNIKKEGGIDLSESVFSSYDTSRERFEVTAGDILIAMSGATTGKVGRYKSTRLAYLNQRVGRFYPRNSLKVDMDFTHQVTSSDRFVSSVLIDAAGGAQPNISNQQIEAFETLFPPLPEQKKIAAILSSVDEVIEKTRAQIDKLKDLKTGMMQELLTKGIGHTEFKDTPVGRIPAGWKVVAFGDLIGSMVGGVSVNGENRVKKVGEIGVLKVSSVSGGKFIASEHKTVIEADLSRAKQNPIQDHILFSRANTPSLVGESAYVDQTYSDLFLPDKLWMIAVKDRNQTYVKWLAYTMCSGRIRRAISDVATGTSGSMKNISKPSLLGVEVALPSYEEQVKIAETIASVDGSLHNTEKKFEHIRLIKKALMQDLLTGKVRVQVDTRELTDA